MKKILIVFIVFFNLFFCVGCKEVSNPLHKEFRNFEDAKAGRLEVSVQNGIYSQKVYDCAFKDNLIEFTYPNRKYDRVIYDVKKGIEYYEGYECNYSAKNKKIINGRPLILERYMSKFSYEEADDSSSITAKFNIIKMTKDSLGLEFFGSDLNEIRKVYTDCWISIILKEGKVKEIKIYPNYEEYEFTYISYYIFEYGDQINIDIALKDNYDEFTNYNDFVAAVEEGRSFSLYPDISPKGYYIKLKEKKFVLSTTAKKHEISFYVAERGAGLVEDVYSSERVDLKEHFKDIDFSVPGTHERLFVYEYEGEKLADFITIHIVEEKEVTASAVASKLPNSQKQFFYENYLGLVFSNSLYLYDLNDMSENHSFDIMGNYKSYYFKDDCLYVASYEKINNNDAEDDYISYITKINLNTFEVEKQFSIDRYVSEMVVDKYGNIIFSKGAGDQVTFEMYNASKEKLEYIENNESKDYCKNAVLLYDEVNERINYLSTQTKDSSRIFEYDSEMGNYKYVNELENTFCSSYNYALNYTKNNQIISNDCYHNFNDSKNNCHKFYSLFYNYDNQFINATTATINDNLAMIGRRYNKEYLVGIIDTQTYGQTNVIIKGIELNSDSISELHYYNGNIYLYDGFDKKLWVAEYK